MTNLATGTNDKSAVEKVVKNINSSKAIKKTKWSKFSDKMDGIFTPNIIEHINNSKDDARKIFVSSLNLR